MVRWIEGAHPEVVDPDTSVDPRREDLAKDTVSVLLAFSQAEVPAGAVGNPHLRAYRGEPLATMDQDTRGNIERCRHLDDFAFDLDAAERVWADAMKLPGTPIGRRRGGITATWQPRTCWCVTEP